MDNRVLTGSYVRKLESRLEALEGAVPSTTSPTSRKRARHERRTSPNGSSVPVFRTGPPSSAQALDRLPSALDLLGLRVDGGDSAPTQADDSASTVDPGDIPPAGDLAPAVDHFFSLVNPAYPMFHEPTVRQDILNLTSSAEKPSSHILHTIYGGFYIHHIHSAARSLPKPQS